MNAEHIHSIPLWPPEDCAQIQLWLNARSDGECSPEQEGWLSQHTSQCEDCSREWASLEGTRLAFESAKLLEPADFERAALQRAFLPGLLGKLGWSLTVLGLLLCSWIVFGDVFENESTLDILAIVGLWTGIGLIGFRTLLEQLRVRRSDPYRKVKR